MENVEKQILKIIKKAKDKGAYFVYGREKRSTMDKPIYYVTIVWTKNQLAPLQANDYSPAELAEQLKKYCKNMKTNEIAVRYHKVQIDANEASIKYHNRMIKDYEIAEKLGEDTSSELPTK